MKVLSKAETATIRALAMCFLPRGGGIDQDAIDAGVLPFIDNWFAKLRPFELLRMRALFRLFEHYIAIENLSPFARFSSAERDDQIAYLSTWEHSGVYARRLAFQGVRSIITLAYDQHPGVQQQMGLGESEEQLIAQAERLADAARMLSGRGGKPTSEAAATATPKAAQAAPAVVSATTNSPTTQKSAANATAATATAGAAATAAKGPTKTAAKKPAAAKAPTKPATKKPAATKAPTKPATKKPAAAKGPTKTATKKAANAKANAAQSDKSDAEQTTPSNSQAS